MSELEDEIKKLKEEISELNKIKKKFNALYRLVVTNDAPGESKEDAWHGFFYCKHPNDQKALVDAGFPDAMA